MSILVPARMTIALWRQNLCRALLLLAYKLGEEKKPFTLDVARRYVEFKAWADGMPQHQVALEVDRAFRWLKEKGILVPFADGFEVAPIAKLRAALESEGEAPAAVGVRA